MRDHGQETRKKDRSLHRQTEPRIFSYVLKRDSGFAPNPFGGVLTLATCKPQIRRSAQPGDWLLGTGSVRNVGSKRVIYAAEISQVLPLERYGEDPTFALKIPVTTAEPWRRHGDNIYFHDPSDDSWRQRRNVHHGQKHMARDLRGENALICRRFWYFGETAPTLPDDLTSFVKTGPGHLKITNATALQLLTSWLGSLRVGLSGQPCVKS
jgi:hypothetical protein